MDTETLHVVSNLISLVSDGKMSELEAERLLNAAARLAAGVPTGSPTQLNGRQDRR